MGTKLLSTTVLSQGLITENSKRPEISAVFYATVIFLKTGLRNSHVLMRSSLNSAALDFLLSSQDLEFRIK